MVGISEALDPKDAHSEESEELFLYHERWELEKKYRKAVNAWIRSLPIRQQVLCRLALGLLKRGGPEPYRQAFWREVRFQIAHKLGWPCPSSTAERCPWDQSKPCRNCQGRINLTRHNLRASIHAAGLLPLWWKDCGRRLAE